MADQTFLVLSSQNEASPKTDVTDMVFFRQYFWTLSSCLSPSNFLTLCAVLSSVSIPAKPGGRVRCQYFPAVDKVLFVDDYAVGCRKDLNGILLLDTALQPPVAKPEDMVQLELPVTEVRDDLTVAIFCCSQQHQEAPHGGGYCHLICDTSCCVWPG